MPDKVTAVPEESIGVSIQMPNSLKVRLEKYITNLFETRGERVTQTKIINTSIDKYLKKFNH